ncbi:MAG: sporulation protein YtfJ [Clostridia bacterium]|nr:sporulation protein YtfJ [Clostridia bacterium]
MENEMTDLIKASIDGVRGFADMNTVIGSPIHTPSGVTVIPVSKIAFGFAGGGLDLFGKKKETNGIGSGSGSGISITPIAFLTVSAEGAVNLTYISEKAEKNVSGITSLIERSPEILKRIRDALE